VELPRAWRVAPDAWVALVLPSPLEARVPAIGRARRIADRRAARVAAVAALGAARLARGRSRISRSHSGGAGAAAVAPEGWSVGVDVIPAGRVTRRHAGAVAGEAEIAAAEAAVGAPGAAGLVWALKESAVKAGGVRGLAAMPEWVIHCVSAGRAELTCSVSHTRALAGWVAVDGFLCAWVVTPPKRP
jgi:phosphopantetheinyl transferase